MAGGKGPKGLVGRSAGLAGRASSLSRPVARLSGCGLPSFWGPAGRLVLLVGSDWQSDRRHSGLLAESCISNVLQRRFPHNIAARLTASSRRRRSQRR